MLFKNGIDNPADLAPAHDCPKIVVSLRRQRGFMCHTTIKKKHTFVLLWFATNKVAFSLHRMRDLTASPVAVSKSKPVCSHLHC